MSKVKDEVIKALQRSSDEHLLSSEEYDYLATLISAVSCSNKNIRDYFYKEVYKIALKIDKKIEAEKDLLKKQTDIIEDMIKDKEVKSEKIKN